MLRNLHRRLGNVNREIVDLDSVKMVDLNLRRYGRVRSKADLPGSHRVDQPFQDPVLQPSEVDIALGEEVS